MYRVRQANFLCYMAFHVQKRKLACRTMYDLDLEWNVECDVGSMKTVVVVCHLC
jgi:hypothetical protein